MDDTNPKRTFIYRRNQVKKPVKAEKGASVNYDHCAIKNFCNSCKYVNDIYKVGLEDKYKAGISILESAEIMKGVRGHFCNEAPKNLAYKTITKMLFVENTSKDPEKFDLRFDNPGSTGFFDVSNCPVHSITIGRFVRKLKVLLEQTDLTPFNPKTKFGDLKELHIHASHLTNELMVTFVTTRDLRKDLKNIISLLRGMEVRIAAAYTQIHTHEFKEVLIGERTRIAGTDKLRETICDFNLEFGPETPFFTDAWQAINFYRRIEQLLDLNQDKSSFAWDLYSGCGVSSLLLAKSGFQVIAVEKNLSAFNDAMANAVRNNLSNHIEFKLGGLGDAKAQIPEKAFSPKIIIVNAPAEGISEITAKTILNVLQNNSKTKVIYVNTNIDTFVKDVKYLSQLGHVPRQLEGFDLEAQTTKMLWMTILTK